MRSLDRHEYDVFIALLVNARLASGLSQGEVARRLGKPQGHFSKIESGHRRMDVIEFLDYARVVGADLATFITTLDAATKAPSNAD